MGKTNCGNEELIFLASAIKGDSRCSENKGKDRPTRTAHVAFLDASYYRPQIIFLLSQACL